MAKKKDSMVGLRVRITRDTIITTGKPHPHAGETGTATTSTVGTGAQYRVFLDSGRTISVPRSLIEPERLQPIDQAARWTNDRGNVTRVEFGEPARFVPTPEHWSQKQSTLRRGADDHRKYPSRVGGERVWMDGRREAVKE